MSLHPARWWHREEAALRCELCPRACLLSEGKRGACGVRLVQDSRLWASAYGVSSGFCVDPVEKKPLWHWLPGKSVLSFGTAGCTLACEFCQNAALSQGSAASLGDTTIRDLVEAARRGACAGVAFTYNEPLVAAEWCIEAAQGCREAGLRTVAVSSGYAQPEARHAFFAAMDAANVDLKAFSEAFYRRYCHGHLAPVLELLQELAEAPIWLELTTLLIPGANDDEAELRALCAWIQDRIGPETPLHFSAFHPAHRMLELPPTPLPTLQRARRLALEAGLRHVYLGNVRDPEGGRTFCAGCGETLIVREGYRIAQNRLDRRCCPACGRLLAGVFP